MPKRPTPPSPPPSNSFWGDQVGGMPRDLWNEIAPWYQRAPAPPPSTIPPILRKGEIPWMNRGPQPVEPSRRPPPIHTNPAPYDEASGDWRSQDQWLPPHFPKATNTPVHMAVPGKSKDAWLRGLGDRGAAGVYGGGSIMAAPPSADITPWYAGAQVYPHETGHAVWFQDLDPFDQQKWLALQTQYPQMRGPQEGFADAVRDYAMAPEWLRTNYPEVHNFFLKAFGGVSYPQQPKQKGK